MARLVLVRSWVIVGLTLSLLLAALFEPAWAGRRRRVAAENRGAQPDPGTGEKDPAPPLPRGNAVLDVVVPQEVERFLAAREAQYGKIENLRLDYTAWDYDPAHGEDWMGNPLSRTVEFGYLAPDKLRHRNVELYRVVEGVAIDFTSPEITTHLNGLSIQFVDQQSGLMGRAPFDGRVLMARMTFDQDRDPLSLLWHTEAAHWKQECHIRIVTPAEFEETEFWLDLHPRRPFSAAKFQRAIMRFKKDEYQPWLMRVYHRGESYSSYQFDNMKINDPNIPTILFSPVKWSTGVIACFPDRKSKSGEHTDTAEAHGAAEAAAGNTAAENTSEADAPAASSGCRQRVRRRR